MRITESLVLMAILFGASSPCYAQHAAAKPSVETLNAELRLLRDQAHQRPDDAQLQFKMAEVLRGLGRTAEALHAYVASTKLSPDMYVSYHHISVLSSDNQQLDDCIHRLNARLKDKPDELMLRVALSELQEKRGNYQLAARPLIDITYANKVPEKYKAKVAGRIHHLLALAKSAQQQETTEAANAEEQLDVVPSPLPAQPSKRSIASAKMKDSREVKGVGKVPLLP